MGFGGLVRKGLRLRVSQADVEILKKHRCYSRG